MRWLASGFDNQAIGRKLRIGERAVKAHVSTLLGTFDCRKRTQLALLGARAGLPSSSCSITSRCRTASISTRSPSKRWSRSKASSTSRNMRRR
jgi:hypothetical protein